MQPPFPSLTAEWHNETYPAITPTLPHLSLASKTVMITGGGRGIGNRTAHAIASAGASLIGITGRTTSSLTSVSASITSLYPHTKVLTFAASILDTDAMNAAFEALKAASPEKLGIDVLIHNAGYFPALSPIGSASADTTEYWSTFETNVRGSYITTRAFLSTLRPKSPTSEPTLIALSTAGACFFPPPPGFSAYATSMVAKARFFDSVAAENPDVRVHNVHPGVIATEMGEKAKEQGMELPADDVELPAHFTVWLLSAEANFLRSRMVWANWDVEELKGMEGKIVKDPAMLNIGMQGWPYQVLA